MSQNLAEVRAAAEIVRYWLSHPDADEPIMEEQEERDYNDDCDRMSAFGSCERCGSNLYPGDDEHYCNQCSWRIENVNPEEG